MAYKLYHKDADYSYVLGPFPAFECLKWRPDLLLAAYYDPAFREIDKFCKLAEKSGIKAETAPKLINKLAHGQKEPYVAVTAATSEQFYARPWLSTLPTSP